MNSIKEKIKAIDKKLWIFLGVCLAIIIVGLIVSKMIYTFGNSNKSYGEVETILKRAGEAYYKENTSSLPVEDGDSVSVGDNILTSEGYMKSLDKLIKNDKCHGKVTVTKVNDLYNYSAYLDCGKVYKTQEFYQKLIDEVVTSGDGLYQDVNGYSYKGDNPDNYIDIDGNLWRIVNIDENNDIEIVSTNLISIISWDDRYNSDEQYSAGYNDFSKSRLKDSLENVSKNKLSYEKDTPVITQTLKNSLVSVNNCVDKYYETDNEFTNCNFLNDNLVSIISLGEYINASLDPKCVSAKNIDCQNYNYLATLDSYWTITADASSSSKIYFIDDSGVIKPRDASNLENIYPVVRLSSSVVYSSGIGTEDKPYIIR